MNHNLNVYNSSLNITEMGLLFQTEESICGAIYCIFVCLMAQGFK